ncbi:formate dehydrogenase subunit gamma [Oleidesulfovibrio sp.]|uniref:formate dehydrogenase subunit gamma n=1 Tax=Oleidesulfovibrio sp. TaxID=2909707 RepID=UPI003A843B49
MRIRRFSPVQKAFHVLLMLTFMLQAASGLSRMYIESVWGTRLTSVFGGYAGALEVHKTVGVLMLLLFAGHICYALYIVAAVRIDKHDSLIPRRSDVREFGQHVRWMLGGDPPRFERWGYWEKFDYWAVFWGMVVLGVTGLLLYSPQTTATYLKGWSLNIALWLHRIEACLAMLHVFVIHFAIVHMRRESFPMDRAMFCGDSEYASASEKWPRWIARLKNAGLLQDRLAEDVSVVRLTISYIFGLAIVVAGVYLLIGGLANIRFISW